jgi:hypothetical protein
MSKSVAPAVTDRAEDTIGELIHAMAAMASTFTSGSYRWGSPAVRGAWIGAPGQVAGWRRSYVGRMSFVKELYKRRHHLAYIYDPSVLPTPREQHFDWMIDDEDREGFFEGIRFDPFFPLAGYP